MTAFDTGQLFSATIATIRHGYQRYDTVGDWHDMPVARPQDVALRVVVSLTPDWRHAALVGVHELVEAILCKHRGVSQDAVDEFDYSHRDADEPGDLTSAPYHREHRFATVIEKLLAAELDIDWREHSAILESLE